MVALIIVFGLGLIAGSFLNSWLWRLELQSGLVPRPNFGGALKSGLGVRSMCPQCGHQLSWKDLVPVVSFALLKGMCRYCRKRISWQYPVVEIVTGALFLALALPMLANPDVGTVAQSGLAMAVWTLLLGILVYDLRHMLIPGQFLYPAIALAFLWHAFEVWSLRYWDLALLATPLVAGLGAAAFFFAIFAFSQGRAMGFGDVQLAFVLGLFLGWPLILPGLFLTFFLGGIIGIILVLGKRKGWRSEIPFGPFLISGALAAFFWGKDLLSWYLSLL